MVGAERAERCQGSGAVHVGVLVGVAADWEAARLRGAVERQHGVVRDAEALKPAVAKVHQPLVEGGRQHLLGQEGRVVVRPAGEFRRQRVRAEEGGDDADRKLPPEPPRGAQHPQLGVAVRP